jgi:hypothetical protein
MDAGRDGICQVSGEWKVRERTLPSRHHLCGFFDEHAVEGADGFRDLAPRQEPVDAKGRRGESTRLESRRRRGRCATPHVLVAGIDPGSNVLRGEVTLRYAIQPTKYNGLTLLPRGPVTNQSSELLLLPSLETLLDDLVDGIR